MDIPQTMGNEKGEVTSGAPVAVKVEHVDSHFTKLWRDVAETAQARGGSAQSVTAAQVLNLLVHVRSYAEGNEFIRDMEHITARHPCRIINMVADPGENEDPVQAWISIYCQVPPAGGRQVCSELVTVAAGRDEIRRIPGAVLPLLISDLPAFLWWPNGSPFDDDLFRNLSDSVDRLIVDSATFENPEGTLAKMSSRLQTNWPEIACTDMNWGRLTRWRELIAQFFDGQMLRPYLDQINNVTIEFTLSERLGVNRAQAMLLAGWLASRLGWQTSGKAYELVRVGSGVPAARLSLRSGQRDITITLQGCQVGTAGDVHSVRLESIPEGSEKAQAGFTVALPDKNEEHAWTCIEIEGVAPTTRPMMMAPHTRAELLDQELEVFSHDRVYEESLQMVGAFIQSSVQPTDPAGPRKDASGEPISAGGQVARTRTPGSGGTAQR